MDNVSVSLFTNEMDGSRVVTVHRRRGRHFKIAIYNNVTRKSASRVAILSKGMSIEVFTTGGVGWTAKA